MGMLKPGSLVARPLHTTDLTAVRRILETSAFTYARFTDAELPSLLGSRPAIGAFTVPNNPLSIMLNTSSLQAFLVTGSLVAPCAWLGGFGVTETESQRFTDYLDLLLPALERALYERGARTLYYSGSDLDADWLRPILEARGFDLVTTLRSYDKDDYAIPAWGDTTLEVRPFARADLPGVVAVENAAFADLWRYDAAGFIEVERTYPYFVVAEDEQGIAGYQFSAVDDRIGYLVRIAAHPRAERRGVGTRLLAEAVYYFERQRTRRIVLNTEDRNTRAHRLYERFGFHQVYPRGFVLGRPIAAS
jgi:ribosomal-protein-alanine N-acetyltransferase